MLIEQLDKCPDCGAGWRYGPNNEFSKIVGVEYGRDRVEDWMCPECKTRWSRGTKSK